MMYGQ